jgi:hypothetical protein
MFSPMKTKLTFSRRAGRARAALLLFSIIGSIGIATVVSAASLSEVLEQGIYSEETKGDLDGALTLYQQVVTDAKGMETVAAQAQYHLGVCYYKKKDYPNATAAFEKLIKEYPGQKDLVARAQEYVAGTTVLLPAPWSDGEEQILDIKLPTGFKIGMITCSVNAGETNGHKIWRLARHTFAGVQAVSRVDVDADTFAPMHSYWKHTLIGEAQTTYSPGQAEVAAKGKDAKNIDLTGAVFDNEEALPLMRRLPLALGYKNNLRVLSSLGGGNIIPMKLEVTAVEKVEVPAGSFECFKAELSIHQTFWYSTDPHRYLVKFEADGVVVELSQVAQHKAGEPMSYDDPDHEFSVNAPSDWNFFTSPRKNDNSNHEVVIVDPDGIATTQLVVGSLDKLKPEQRKSLRDWADSEIADPANGMKDLKIRPDSWQQRTVAGQPALSAIGDFVDGKDNKVAYGVFSFHGTNLVNIHTLVDARDFDAFKPKFDAIVDSFKTN